MNAITRADVLVSTNLTSLTNADSELISLGRLFDDALVRERAAWDALTDECEDDDPAAVLADRLNDETGVIVDQIELHAATTLSGVLIKARAMEWCRAALPGRPVTITEIDNDPHPSTYIKILVTLLNDMNAMARGEAGHSRSRAGSPPPTPSADPALIQAVEQVLAADQRYDNPGFEDEPGCNEHVNTWDERLAVVSNAPGSTMADFAEKARALVASIQREINPIDRDLALPPPLAMALKLAQDLIAAGTQGDTAGSENDGSAAIARPIYDEDGALVDMGGEPADGAPDYTPHPTSAPLCPEDRLQGLP